MNNTDRREALETFEEELRERGFEGEELEDRLCDFAEELFNN